MRIICALLVVLALQHTAIAQGAVQFLVNLSGANEVPPNTITVTASGSLELTGDNLGYDLSGIRGLYFFTEASINGPVDVDHNASVLFDLGPVKPINPLEPGGQYVVQGSLNGLTAPQVNDLQEGLCYVNIYSAAYPDQQIRGQIVLAPEPATWTLLFAGVAVLAGLKGKRKSPNRIMRAPPAGPASGISGPLPAVGP